jgi:SAM-dependent methyltransferase
MIEDRKKWEARHQRSKDSDQWPDPLITENQSLLRNGLALDLACGEGRHSLFLAQQGYEVIGLDISLTALQKLKTQADSKGLPIYPVLADLDYFPLPENSFDVVALFYFYDPSLFESINDSLKKEGILFYSTYNENHLSVKPEFNQDYLVPQNMLERSFQGLRIVYSNDRAGPSNNISQIIGLKDS